jgi:hypothetical protein
MKEIKLRITDALFNHLEKTCNIKDTAEDIFGGVFGSSFPKGSRQSTVDSIVNAIRKGNDSILLYTTDDPEIDVKVKPKCTTKKEEKSDD